jgi:uncharacterized membrane protein YqjE
MDDAPPDSPPSGARGLSEPLLRYLEARGVLLSIEAQEALQLVIRLMVFAGIASAAAFMGWVLLTAALVNVIMNAAGWHWVKAATVLGFAHVALAVVFLLVARNRLGGLRFFHETLNEFKKDREWLASQTHKH